MLITLAVIFVISIPLLGSLLHYHGHLPPGFFVFPPTDATPKPGFNLTIFIVLLLACIFITVLYIYPWIFGFKRPPAKTASAVPKVKFPVWFAAGLVIALIDAFLLWGHFASPRFMINLGYIPIIWGIVFMLDGIVYKRTGGQSILGNKPWQMFWIALCSAFAWGYFEYLGLFVGVNWYYPEAELLTTTEFYIYAFIGGAALVPFVFEVYMLLKTFKVFCNRYSYGPQISISRITQIVILLIFITALFLISYFPFILYPLLWIGPVVIISILLDIGGIWTPFRPIVTAGNWTPLALIGLGNFISGFLCEAINYLSAEHNPFHTFIPGYWKYSIPYVDTWHIFEMPLEGLYGYLPYGIYNWVVWIGFAYFLNISTNFEKNT